MHPSERNTLPSETLPEPASAKAGILSSGAELTTFKLPRDGGEIVSLAPAEGRNLVVFFYPRADTPGCTKEAMDFSRLVADFDGARTDIMGVSADPPKNQEAFRDRHDLRIPLLSDETHVALQAFGVWGQKSMYGKTFDGIFRTTVLIGPDRRIINIWRGVKVDGHADEVLAYVKAL